MPPKLNPRAKIIRDLCKEARDRFTPESDGTTYCNMGVNHVAMGLDYGKFAKKLANEMVQIMERNAEWAEISAECAKRLADDGRFVVAGRQDDPHGHVAVVLPNEKLIRSNKWNGLCPTVSNVGKENWICGANYAFSRMPKYYVWIEDV
jgi:hypothetical protein